MRGACEVVDQKWDRVPERAGKEGLPKVKGPLDAVAANVTQKGQVDGGLYFDTALVKGA